jgi:hypothetical protein
MSSHAQGQLQSLPLEFLHQLKPKQLKIVFNMFQALDWCMVGLQTTSVATVTTDVFREKNWIMNAKEIS